VSQTLIAALQNPALYPHPVTAFNVIETHISWVILTGEYAYKIKKPVNFGFLDFTEAEARGHFCREELRLNQRLTQGLYLDVLPITGTAEAPQIGGTGPAFDYAIKMREFPQNQLLSEIEKRGELTEQHIDALAEQIARFHMSAPLVDATNELGSPESVMAPVRQNFEQIRPLLEHSKDLAQLDHLEAWAEEHFARLQPLFEQRKAEGFIRECHGDIYLANVTQLDGQVVLFDCIEFNEPFRMTDVIADTAFLAMDLEDRNHKTLARRFINAYFEMTGDYTGLHVLPFYKAYRAMVRAKVSLFQYSQAADPIQKAEILERYRNYAALAESYCAIPYCMLTITHGVSAVGKSSVALKLVEALGAIRIRSDVERKRLTQNTALETLYSAEAGHATYARLHELAAEVLKAGYPVVLDATYLRHEQRQAAATVAERAAVPFLILDCHAPDAVIAQWLAERQAEGRDPSDATLAVIQTQQQGREALTEQEKVRTRSLDMTDPASLDVLVKIMQEKLPVN
jgi:aminoglycoside phosphotransferase family enzyme/predicted kinase